MTPIRMAVVGVGALGRHHARILDGMPGVDLIAVVDPREEQGQAIAQQYDTRWVADFRDVLDDVDAAAIVVPTTKHLEVAGEFLSRGIPVMVEKPLAATVAQADRLVRRAAASNTLLQVGHVERFNPAYRALRSVVGTPKYIRAERVSPFSFRSIDIGAVHDLMIHDIDLVLDLLDGELPSRCEAFGVTLMGGEEDSVQARLGFDNGCIVDLVASRVHPEARRSIEVWSTTGAARADFFSREVVRISPTPTLLAGPSPTELARQPGSDIAELKERVHGSFLETEHIAVAEADALTDELAEFVRCVQFEAEPTVTGEAGLAAMRVADMVLESVATHAWNGQQPGPVGPVLPTPQPMRRAG